MAQQRLLTGLTPTSPNVVENIANTVATTVVFAEDGTLDGIEFLTTNTISGTYGVAAWQTTADDSPAETGTGTLLDAEAVTPVGTNTMQSVFFDPPIPVTAGVKYRLGLRTSEARYAATGGYFNSAGLTSGDITAPQTGTDGYANGTYIESATAYPVKTFNGNLYHVGPIYTPAGEVPPEEHTSTGTGRATADARATVATVRVSVGSATAGAGATASASTRRTSTGTLAATASASASITPCHVSTGTARATATGGNYTAGGSPGPWLTSRRRQGRIVSRTQVAR
jgi:hypothetical protein